MTPCVRLGGLHIFPDSFELHTAAAAKLSWAAGDFGCKFFVVEQCLLWKRWSAERLPACRTCVRGYPKASTLRGVNNVGDMNGRCYLGGQVCLVLSQRTEKVTAFSFQTLLYRHCRHRPPGTHKTHTRASTPLTFWLCGRHCYCCWQHFIRVQTFPMVLPHVTLAQVCCLPHSHC